MMLLGVFDSIYGAGAEMTVPRALLISAVGFLIVFMILGVLALFVRLMGRVFDAAAAKKKAAALTAVPPTAPEKKPVPAGIPLPEGVSQGSLTLVDVSEEEAAVIMAVTAHRTGIPLNRLEFHSIRLIGEED